MSVELVDARGGERLWTRRYDAKESELPAVEQRNEFESVSEMADPTKNLVSELGILGVEVTRQVASTATNWKRDASPHGITGNSTCVVPDSEIGTRSVRSGGMHCWP